MYKINPKVKTWLKYLAGVFTLAVIWQATLLTKDLLHRNTKDVNSTVHSRLKVAALAAELYKQDHSHLPDTDDEAEYTKALQPYLMSSRYSDASNEFYIFRQFANGDGIALGPEAKESNKPNQREGIIFYERQPKNGKWNVVREGGNQFRISTLGLSQFTPPK